MSNTILTPTAVTREVQRVLHQQAVLSKRVNRQYDDSYANSGAKIGDSLKVRLPNQYTVRSGKTIDVQDTTESSVTITMGTQKGVDMNFSSKELTLDLDDFSKRIIVPAVSRLVSEIDKDGFALYADIYNLVGTAGTTPATALVALQAGQKLDEYLAPDDGSRTMAVNAAANAAMVDGLKGLFHAGDKLEDQYEKGEMGRGVLGFDWYKSTLVNTHTNSAGTASVTVNDAAIASGDTAVTVNTTTTAYSAGSVVTFAGCYAVHPETKVAYPHLQQFVIVSATATELTVSPAIITSGATQNVSAVPTNGGAVTLVGAASGSYAQNLAFHRDAFALVTADLEDVSKYGAWGGREVMDGISIRVARQYDINNDNIPCRLDVLYGWKTLRAQLACRVTG